VQVHDEIQEADYITPNQPGGIPGWQEGIPVFRIYTCGLFTIEMLVGVPGSDPAQARYTELPTDRLFGRGPGSAQKAVKILLAQDERYATKDWLRTHLREGQEVCATNKRLENIISYLRCHLLCLPSGKKLSDLLTYRRGTEESGDGYQLASYPLVWVDVDALTWYVKHACLKERFGEDSLPYWERAYALASRGSFLVDEPNSEWASRRRKVVDDQIRQCVLALSRLYLARYGQAGEEDVLRLLLPYCRTHCQDEDALRSLLELLNKRGRYQEVLEWYKQLEDALAEAEPDKAGAMRTPHPLTAEIADFARLKLHEGHQAKSSSPLTEGASLSTLYVDAQVGNSFALPELLATSQERSGAIVDTTPPFRVLSKEGMHRAVDEGVQVETSWTTSLRMLPVDQIALLISLVELGANGMAHDAAKRATLRQIFAALSLIAAEQSAIINPEPWERLARARVQPAALNEETLHHFEHLLGVCWDLSNTQALDVAEAVLSSFLPKLLALPQKEGRIAIFLSHSLRLWSILAHHRLNLASKVQLCEQSVEYAHLAHDPNSLVPALIELASAYEGTNQPEKRFKALQEALYQSTHASPLVQSRAYSRNAVILAESGREREAQLYIGLAQEVFPNDPTKDPGFLFTDSSIFRFSYHAGLVRVLTGNAAKADDAFELYKQHPSGSHIPERIRLEIANGQSKAAILINDAERYATLLEAVIIGSANIGSKKRLDEAYRIFRDQMPPAWLAHQHIQTLTEKYHLKREE
jgi:tetratricopeptide (TPR) repeat protein